MNDDVDVVVVVNVYGVYFGKIDGLWSEVCRVMGCDMIFGGMINDEKDVCWVIWVNCLDYVGIGLWCFMMMKENFVFVFGLWGVVVLVV